MSSEKKKFISSGTAIVFVVLDRILDRVCQIAGLNADSPGLIQDIREWFNAMSGTLNFEMFRWGALASILAGIWLIPWWLGSRKKRATEHREAPKVGSQQLAAFQEFLRSAKLDIPGPNEHQQDWDGWLDGLLRFVQARCEPQYASDFVVALRGATNSPHGRAIVTRQIDWLLKTTDEKHLRDSGRTPAVDPESSVSHKITDAGERAGDSIKLKVTFDSSDPACNDCDVGRHSYRIRVSASSNAKTVRDVGVIVTGIRTIYGVMPLYVSRHFQDKILKPLHHDGPRFDLHDGANEPVSVVKNLGVLDKAPGWLYLCRHDAEQERDTGIEAGRYVIKIKAYGRDCMPCEEEFFVGLTVSGFAFEPFDRNRDYRSLPTFMKEIDSLVSKSEHCAKTREMSVAWCYDVSHLFQCAVSPYFAKLFDEQFRKHVYDIEDDSRRSGCIDRGVVYLRWLKDNVKDEELR